MSDTIRDDREIKARARAMWASGDFPEVARTVTPVGRRLVEAAGIRAGQRVLDVAAGSGNTAIPAALTGAEVVASDLTPELFETGRRDAAAAGASLDWVEADAEALPFPSASFDVVTSSFGAMFAPRHEMVASELLRVCRPGGMIAMANWTPDGQIGAFFGAMAPFMPQPPPGASPPPLWGDEEHVRELLAGGADELRMAREVVDVTAFATPEAFVAFYQDNFGPTIMAYRNVGDDERRRAELDAALLDFARRWNVAPEGQPARYAFEYLLVLARRAG